MTTKKEYFCNLCREQFGPNDLHGLSWTFSGWVKGDSWRVENHICGECLGSITEIGNQYRAMRSIEGDEL